MKRILLLASLLLQVAAYAQTFPVTDLRVNGRKDNRINLVILPDGYTAAQQVRFRQQADTIRKHAFVYTPLKEYINFFNAYCIQVPSVDSGVNHPFTASDIPETGTPVVVNNYFGSIFDGGGGGVHRALVVGKPAVVSSVLATNFPDYDLIYVLSNTTMYGGTGGKFATGTVNSASVQVAVHEWGHSFAHLADEYWPGYGYRAPNMSDDNDPASVVWKNWLGYKSTGIYPYESGGPGAAWFRPHQNCMMQYLDTVLCPVCKQAFIDEIYRMVNPIDTVSPGTSVAVSYTTGTLPFSVTLIKPIPNTFKIRWELNGSAIAFTDTFSLVSGGMLRSGSNTLTVFVTDTTTLSRSYWPDAGYQFSASWKINNSGTGIIETGPASRGGKFAYKVFPVPASGSFTLEYDNQTNTRQLQYQLTDISGRVLREQLVNVQAGKGRIQQDISGLPAGIYLVQLRGADISLSTRISIE